MGVRTVRICALLDRRDARIIDIPLDYVGFEAPDEVLSGTDSPPTRASATPYIRPIHEGAEA